MSGIAGLVFFDQTKVQLRNLEKMKTALAHRGTDGANLFFEENVGLIHLMLHVSPESISEKQPFSTQNKIITADVRIDNREDLIEKLNLKPTYAPVIHDSEIILAAYEFWGEDCLFHLIGDFAFAIWDATKQQLFCGRDHLGVRPFYYYYKKGEVFAFASEIKALLALDFVPKILNKEKIAIYLCWLSDNRAYKESTFYEQIVSLQPAFSLKVNKENIEKKFCWDFNLERFSHLKTEEDFVNAFREHFIEAVRCRTRTSFGIASHLSGGLDSSSVACVASKISQREINSFHFDFKLETSDETEYATEITKHYPTLRLNYINPTDSISDGSTKISYISDYPDLAVLSSLPYLEMAEKLKKYKCRICLTGHNGDAVVRYGTNYLNQLVSERKFNLFEKAINEYATLLKGKRNGKEMGFRSKKKILLVNYLIDNFLKKLRNLKFLAAGKILIYNKSLGGSNILFVKRILKITWQGFKQKWHNPNMIIHHIMHLSNLNQLIKLNLNHDLQLDLPQNLKDNFFEVYNGTHIEYNEQQNTLGNYYQYSIVHPFFDKRLIELCMIIPDEINFKNGYLRGILRESMIDILPEKVRQRTTKASFTQFLKKVSETYKKTDFLKHFDKKTTTKIMRMKEKSPFNYARFIFISQWLKQKL